MYLWLGWWPGESDSGKSTAVTGMALSRWLQDKGLALKTVQAYARGMYSVRHCMSLTIVVMLRTAISRRCPAYVVVAGFEPDQFTSLFPTWQQQQDIRDRAAHVIAISSCNSYHLSELIMLRRCVNLLVGYCWWKMS